MKQDITIGEKYSPAMKITDEAEARAYLEECITHNITASGGQRTYAEAERIEKSNLAYYAGYYDNATRERVERLFRCAHPVFGGIAINGAPTPEQAFAAGVKWGQKDRTKMEPSLGTDGNTIYTGE